MSEDETQTQNEKLDLDKVSSDAMYLKEYLGDLRFWHTKEIEVWFDTELHKFLNNNDMNYNEIEISYITDERGLFSTISFLRAYIGEAEIEIQPENVLKHIENVLENFEDDEEYAVENATGVNAITILAQSQCGQKKIYVGVQFLGYTDHYFFL
jgi:hypothetical protein